MTMFFSFRSTYEPLICRLWFSWSLSPWSSNLSYISCTSISQEHNSLCWCLSRVTCCRGSSNIGPLKQVLWFCDWTYWWSPKTSTWSIQPRIWPGGKHQKRTWTSSTIKFSQGCLRKAFYFSNKFKRKEKCYHIGIWVQGRLDPSKRRFFFQPLN